VTRGTPPGPMALWAHHLTVERSLFYCAPFTAWQAQPRSNEGGGSLRAEGALSRRARAGPRAALPARRPGAPRARSAAEEGFGNQGFPTAALPQGGVGQQAG